MDLSFLASLKSSSELIAHQGKKFKNLLHLATECMTATDYSNAEMLYISILEESETDGLRHFVNLQDLELFSVYCCLAYASIGTDSKGDVLDLLNTMDNNIKLPLVPYLRAFRHLLHDRIADACDEIKTCQTLLDGGYNFKANAILNENIIPEIDEKFIKLKLNGLRFTCEILTDKAESISMRKAFKENWLKIGKLCPIDFAKLDKKNGMENLAKMNEGKMLETDAISKTDRTVIQPIQITTKTIDVGVQTNTSSKGATVGVQTNKEVSSQILTAVLEIKNKMNNLQNNKDNKIKALQKENAELNEKLLAKESKRDEWHLEFDFLKLQYYRLEKRYEESQKQVEVLQKLFTDELQQKCSMQKYLYQKNEEKCLYKIEYLNEIQNSLQDENAILSADFGQETALWRRSLNKIIDEKGMFEVYYRNVDELLANKSFSFIDVRAWPGIPCTPPDIYDLVHRHLKLFITQGKAFAQIPYPPTYQQFLKTFAHMMNSPVTNTSCNQDGPTTASPTFSGAPRGRVSDTKPASSGTSTNKAASSTQPDLDPRYENEIDLFEFLQTAFEDIDELKLCQAVCSVRDTHGGDLENFPRQQLVEEIKKYFKKGKSRKNAWIKVKRTTWHNDHSDKKCVICFDDFDESTCHTLRCQHEFHKECIANWLEQQSVCPVCRVHAVLYDEFPPL